MGEKSDSGQKRKRRADGSTKPSKRVAVETSESITVLAREPDEWAPVMATTPGVTISSSIFHKAYTKSRNYPPLEGRTDSIATKELLLQSSDHPRIDYTGQEESNIDGGPPHLRHYIGVYDPRTGELEVVEGRKLCIRASVRAHRITEEDVKPMTMREQRTALGEVFGTKKAKKAILSKTENAITPGQAARFQGPDGLTTINSAASIIMAGMAESTASMATSKELQKAADAAKPRPKANMVTDDINEVYTINTLVGLDTMKLIPVRTWQQTMNNNQEVVSTSKYVARRLKRFSGNVEKLKLLRYVQLLVDFYNKARPGRSGRSLPKREEMNSILGDMPEAVLESVKRKFTDGPQMSKFKVDLMITHICALACVIENFEFNPQDLKDDMKWEVAELTKYFREIGAKVGNLPETERKQMRLEKAAAAQMRYIKLKLPLDFPKTGFGRRK